MNQHITVHATVRDSLYDLTTSIPGIVYGQDKKPEPILLDRKAIDKVFTSNAFHTHIIDLMVAGKKTQAVVKDWQINGLSRKVIHIDFYRISSKSPVSLFVPVQLEGVEENKAIKDQHGILESHITELEVNCLPKDIPETITIDISEIALKESFHLSQLKLPKKVALVLNIDDTHDPAVITIQPPKGTSEENTDETEEPTT